MIQMPLAPEQARYLTHATLVLDGSTLTTRSPLIAVQPVRRAPDLVAASLRSQIARLVRAHGYRTVTTIPSIESTAEYAALAHDRRLTAFVVGDLDRSKRRPLLTMVVLGGERGSVLGRWSVSAPVKNPGKFLANGFWKGLGPALEKARAPELPVIPPPADINASQHTISSSRP
jgi:hypothetical protein